MSELKSRLQADMKLAMKAGERERLGVIRLILAAVKQREVDERVELTDTDIIVVLDRMVKQRRESIRQYEEGGRPELAAVEQAEIEQIELYLPQPLSDAELESLISGSIAEAGATGVSDMGKVMALVKPRAQGRCDMAAVSGRIKQLLSS